MTLISHLQFGLFGPDQGKKMTHVVLVWFIFTHIFVFNKQTKKQIYKLKMSQRPHEETGNRLLA